ncbi:MarR family winged helix-turn-helix transcriptional regulator [Mesobacillus harenae]|uniref:MarR family winged helix-turn-helix transcriptional regulator n=1 Tax=Mesobacillus harenae TaxID=2213203 RepID=UPI001580DC8A|nr:MarR family transcriptional regulator [Mesobacillus harenae]
MKLSLADYIGVFIHQTDLTFTNYVKNKLAPYNLAPEQNLVMMILFEKDGITQNELSEKLMKDKTNIARMVSSLERKGFIRRVVNEQDRRALHLYLTVEGRALGDKIIPISEEFNSLILEDISEKEMAEVKRILIKMKNNLTKR